MDPKYQVFVKEETFNRYAKEIGKSFNTESERQIACMVAADLVDPRTGFDAAAGYLCPSLVDYQYQKIERLAALTATKEEEQDLEKDMDDEWEPLDAMLLMLVLNPFSTAHGKGYFADMEYQGKRSSWLELNKMSTNVLMELNKVPLNDNFVVSNLKKTNTARWTISDPRSFAKLGADAIEKEVRNLYKAAFAMSEGISDQIDQTLNSMEKILTKQIDSSIVKAKKLIDQGSYNLKKSITMNMVNLTYDMQNQVQSTWNADGSQRSYDPCTHRTSDSAYPTSSEECKELEFTEILFDTSTTYNCEWAAATNKCGGFSQPSIAQFRSDVMKGEDWRSNMMLYDGEDQMIRMGEKSVTTLVDNANTLAKLITTEMNKLSQYANTQLLESTKALYSMYNDLKISSIISQFKISQIVSEKTFEATNSAIRLVKYVIGTYIGFGVVSKLLPFALAIVAGVKKGVTSFAKVTAQSKAFETKGDSLSLKRFNALLLFTSGLVVAVPMITIAIFFYQAYAEQYFILVVLAIEIWSVGQAFKGFVSDRTNLLVTLLSCSLGVAGLVCWIIYDENAMFLGEYLVQIVGRIDWTLSILKVVERVSSFGFNFYFSQVITAQLIARLSASMFAHRATGPMFYHMTNDDGVVEHIPSNLGALDVFSLVARTKAYDEQKKFETIQEGKEKTSSSTELEMTAISISNKIPQRRGGDNKSMVTNPHWSKIRTAVKVSKSIKSEGQKQRTKRLSRLIKARRDSENGESKKF
jgi:hypothetical protein